MIWVDCHQPFQFFYLLFFFILLFRCSFILFFFFTMLKLIIDFLDKFSLERLEPKLVFKISFINAKVIFYLRMKRVVDNFRLFITFWLNLSYHRVKPFLRRNIGRSNHYFWKFYQKFHKLLKMKISGVWTASNIQVIQFLLLSSFLWKKVVFFEKKYQFLVVHCLRFMFDSIETRLYPSKMVLLSVKFKKSLKI